MVDYTFHHFWCFARACRLFGEEMHWLSMELLAFEDSPGGVAARRFLAVERSRSRKEGT